MRTVQLFVSANCGKWLIAEAIGAMEPVRRALEGGKLVFKGGTTVSCVSQHITGQPLRISGRMTLRGAVAARELNEKIPHTLLWQNGQARNLDSCVDDALLELGPGDVMITGANVIDAHGDAAMLAGAPGGFHCGKAVSAMTTEGFRVIVAAGLEKLVPGRVRDSILSARRQGVDRADGMACGLFPIYGEVVTELEAMRLLADVEVAVIGRGGIHGAEGGTLLQVWGEEAAVRRLEEIVERCKAGPVGGDPGSLVECRVPSYGCASHLSCRYRADKAGDNRTP